MKLIVISLIKLYQQILSPYLGTNCRFSPTCSEYTARSVKKYGVMKGVSMGMKQLSKCHPWSTS